MFTALSYNYGFTVEEILDMNFKHIEVYLDALGDKGSSSTEITDHESNMNLAAKYGLKGIRKF